MSNERMPIFIDRQLETRSAAAQEKHGFDRLGRSHFQLGMEAMRMEYELLIEEGRLRLVEEVGWHTDENDDQPMCDLCNTPIYQMWDVEKPHCAGCGNPIKR